MKPSIAGAILLFLLPIICSAGVSVPEATGFYEAPMFREMSFDLSRDFTEITGLSVSWSGKQTFGTLWNGDAVEGSEYLTGDLVVRIIDPAGPVWTCTFEPSGENLTSGFTKVECDTSEFLDFLLAGEVAMDVLFVNSPHILSGLMIDPPLLDIIAFNINPHGAVVDSQTETWGGIKALYR